MLKHIVMVAFAGAIGAVCRYSVVNYIGGRYFPWGTMTVNVLGSAIMGVAFVVIMEKGLVSADMKPLVMTGFLGAFTTYSAFSLEANSFSSRFSISNCERISLLTSASRRSMN